MPLPTDSKALQLSKDVLQAFDNANGGVHQGFRPGHAKGILLAGAFHPSPDAATLTRAPHMRAVTPVTARFSDFAGIPTIPDFANEASPRGLAIRFNLAEHVHTDIVAHSVDNFPARTAEELIGFLGAIAATKPDQPHPNAIEQYLGAHPVALAFVQVPKPIPSTFARESFFAVSAFKFTAANGASRYGRYRILPELGNDYPDAAVSAAKSPDFLFDEIKQRIVRGPIRFNIVVQLAEAGDPTDNSTVRWPENRPKLTLGSLELRSLVPENDAAQRQIIFDPIPRVDGIESSEDPLFQPRADAYLLSGRRRRA